MNENKTTNEAYSFSFTRGEKEVVDIFGLDNVFKFDEETDLFSYYYNIYLDIFAEYFKSDEDIMDILSISYGVDFKNGTLPYEEFKNQLAKLIDIMRKDGAFENNSYGWLIGEFRDNHPEIFIDKNAPIELKNAFYSGKLNAETLYHHEEYIPYLINKNLTDTLQLHMEILTFGKGDVDFENEYTKRYGKEKLLKLICKYGNLINDVVILSDKGEIENEQATEKQLRKAIYDFIKMTPKTIDISYEHLSDIPEFVEEYPNLFINLEGITSIPQSKRQEITKMSYKRHLTYDIIKDYPELIPILKSKDLKVIMEDKLELLYVFEAEKFLKLCSEYGNSLNIPFYSIGVRLKFFEIFGADKAIELCIKKIKAIDDVEYLDEVELIKKWYDKTGGKFIPDLVVIRNFDINEADKFLTSGSNWSKLMKIKEYAESPESRSAMLKLAYSFGVFDQDQKGFKEIIDLLTGVPKKIDSNLEYVIQEIDKFIDVDENNTKKTSEMTPKEKEEAYIKLIDNIDEDEMDTLTYKNLVDLLHTLSEEQIEIDLSKPIFSQLYRKNNDGTYIIAFNNQSFPKLTQSIRKILEPFYEIPILTPDKAHESFGGFELKYDADFRDFLLSNIDEILMNSKYISFVSNVQRQFDIIKTTNSNRRLTWDLAISFIQNNIYENVNIGNEAVVEISSIAGYSQSDFDILQQIYNYGKQRTFSSIPRIENTNNKYTYEILRLDDPLAMAIGTLTNCCQRLHDDAEMCMEHSMIDKNGRVFVVKDSQGNIVAQSWVWRNKDVLCFDNIEVPKKALERSEKQDKKSGTTKFAEEIYSVYKQAAHELIEKDEKVYRDLLKNNQITKEQYEGLRLGKITVGLGYNDIADSIKRNSFIDKAKRVEPLPFKAPVKLKERLYIKDSKTQYILDERTERKPIESETLSVHNDTYIEYDDSNFTKRNLLTFEKLEKLTKEDQTTLKVSTNDYEQEEQNHIVTDLAENYGLNPETTKIVINSNFAIIYDINGENLKIGDLLFNTNIENEKQQINIENKVIIQMRLALEQIAGNKQIDISALNEKQIKMYEKVIGLTNEIDVERGVNHAK